MPQDNLLGPDPTLEVPPKMTEQSLTAEFLGGPVPTALSHPTSLAASADSRTQSNRPESPEVAEAEGLATSSVFAGRQDGDSGSIRVHQQAQGSAINLDQVVGNILYLPTSGSTSGERVPRPAPAAAISMNQVIGNVFTGTNHGHITQTIEEFQVLRNLPIHPDISGHLSDYFPNSRADDEAAILEWIDSKHSPELVLCVLGKVGVGKSTLAKHLATRLRENKRLAAEIYLGFALPDWSPESVFRMVAGQLCGTYPTLTRVISEAIRLDVSPSVSLETRIQTLILEPIRSLHHSGPLVVVMDALDQWATHAILTKALKCLTSETHLIRFVVLGRPGLEHRFQNVPLKRYDLPGVSKSVMGDYFRDRFEQVQWEYGRKPSAQTIEKLVDKANGLFVWSSILCSILEDQLSCPGPHDTLVAILQSQQSIGDNDSLANLYDSAINLWFPKTAHKAKLKLYLEAVLVLREPLPSSAFASLVSMEVAAVRRVRADLEPLQTGQARNTQDVVYPASSTFHLSFLEYLQSSDTPSHLVFPIDILTSQFRLGLACLEELRRLPSSPTGFRYISPLQRYAMRYWPIHVGCGTPLVSPTSDVAWRATPHSAILHSLSVLQWQHWAGWYLQTVCRVAVQDLSIGELAESQAPCSVEAKPLSVFTAIRSLWVKLFHQPAQEASVTMICRISQSLRRSQATAGSPDAIAVAEAAIRLQHRNSDAWLIVGTAYYDATQRNLSSRLLQTAVQACRYAADLCGDGGRQVRRALADCLWLRFLLLHSLEDLNEAILLQRTVLQLTPLGHLDRARSLNDLAISLISRLDHIRTTENLEEAIVLHREALSLQPPSHPDRPSSLDHLATSLESHYKHTGKPESLDGAILLHREALALRLPDHPDYVVLLHSLANSLLSHYDLTGTSESLDEAILLQREALSLQAPGHPDRPLSLHNLAYSLHSRSDYRRASDDLDEAITLHRESLSLWPLDHPHRAQSLNNLASALQSHSDLTGSADSQDEVIALRREVLLLWHPGHPGHAISLNNLADSLRSHFDHTGTIHSVGEAIALHREALLLWPPGHPNRAFALIGLARSLQSHFDRTGTPESLDEAIMLRREGLSLLPPGRPKRQHSLRNLSHLLHCHFDLTGTTESLDEAISLGREALSLCPPGHPNRSTCLSTLSNALFASHRLTGSIDSLNEARLLSPLDAQPTQ